MVVVYVADKNYMPYVEISARSVLKYNNTKIIVVSPEPVDTQYENVVIPLKEEYRQTENDRITQTTYLKLFLTQLPYDKIIYLDGDTICNGKLDELWRMDCDYINLCDTFSQKHKNDLKVEKYGLSGMMVMNLKALREIDFTNLCLKTNPNVKHWQHEETLINVAMHDKLHFIDNKWNYCYKRDYGDGSKEFDAVILHICGKNKSRMYWQPFAEIKEIIDFIHGKTVAIVGNAQSIFDKENGQAIDNHEVIIRFNKGYIIKPESQGTKTDILIMACEVPLDDKAKFKAKYYINRSKNTRNGSYTISDQTREYIRRDTIAQPSSGFMAIRMCEGAKSIDLYGFDGITPTFYNPKDYVTQHNYSREQEIIKELKQKGLLSIN